MSQASVVHAFFDVYMGWSHKSLAEILKKYAGKAELERGEVAVFINKGWTAAKILGPGGVILYYRSPTGAAADVETIRYLPTMLGAPRLAFARNLEAQVIKTFEGKFGKKLKRLSVATA